ncbi:MAG: hypothetical protein MHPSP_003789 [Paramarteilia canceri]
MQNDECRGCSDNQKFKNAVSVSQANINDYECIPCPAGTKASNEKCHQIKECSIPINCGQDEYLDVIKNECKKCATILKGSKGRINVNDLSKDNCQCPELESIDFDALKIICINKNQAFQNRFEIIGASFAEEDEDSLTCSCNMTQESSSKTCQKCIDSHNQVANEEIKTSDIKNCPAGQYANSTGECIMCPISSYRKINAENQCEKCFKFLASDKEGAKNWKECISLKNLLKYSLISFFGILILILCIVICVHTYKRSEKKTKPEIKNLYQLENDSAAFY